MKRTLPPLDRALSRRSFARSSALLAAGAVSAFAGRPSFLDAQGRTITGEPVVITAPIEPLGQDARPSGEQLLRLAGQTQGPDTLDPHLARDLPTTFLLRQIYRGLVRLGPTLEPVPELAERIEISADGLEYTFSLRSEATFQDGRQITAADVAFSLTHALDSATAGGEAALLGGPTFLSDIVGAVELTASAAEDLAGVEVLDERTVRIRLAEPRAAFLMKIAAVQAAIIDPNDVASRPEWRRQPNGSGPFRVVEWAPDDHISLERFDGFFAGPPPLERVEVALGPNAFNSFNLYLSDRLEIDSVPFETVDLILAPNNPLRWEVTVTEGLGTFYIAFRTDTPPMDDPRIRRAIFQGFPRDKYANLTFNGTVTPAEGLIPNGMLGRDWPVDDDPYDLDAARAEIAASTYGSPENVPTLEIYTSFGGPAEALRDVLRADLGLSVEVYAVDWLQFIDGLARRRFPAYSWYWGADYPDPEIFIWTLFGKDSPDNYIDYQNPEMNELIRQARVETDVERRADLYAAANELLMADHAVIPLYYDVYYTLVKPYVRDLEQTALGIVRLDTIWLER